MYIIRLKLTSFALYVLRYNAEALDVQILGSKSLDESFTKQENIQTALRYIWCTNHAATRYHPSQNVSRIVTHSQVPHPLAFPY